MDSRSNGVDKPVASNIEAAVAGVISHVGRKKTAIAVVAIWMLSQQGASPWMIFGLAVIAIVAQLVYDLVAATQWLVRDDLKSGQAPDALPEGGAGVAPAAGRETAP
jgi:hypothetical protein